MNPRTAVRFLAVFLCWAPLVPASTPAPTRFAVLSDVHFYDASLGTEGEAFEAYLARDGKLLRESEAILRAALGSIVRDAVSFAVICGDLTKDGERLCHEEVGAYLSGLERAGVQAFVVPGNHDILNPHAASFQGSEAHPVPSVTPEEFAAIYRRFGFGEALQRDPASLSYVAEPVSGLWLLAMDSCDYHLNPTRDHPVVAGSLSPSTLKWILGVLAEAQAAGKRVIGVSHHGLLEHFSGQADLFADYVVHDWVSTSKTLAEAGLQVVLTGHFHANDITRRTWPTEGDAPFLIDVETGSLASYPTPYRLVTLIDDNRMEVESRFVDFIEYDTGGQSFPTYARVFTWQSLFRLAGDRLTRPAQDGGFGLPTGFLTDILAGFVGNALLAHYEGDEQPPPMLIDLLRTLVEMDDDTLSPLAGSLYDAWYDLLPADSTVSLYLGPRRVRRHLLGDHPGAILGWADIDTFTFDGREGERVLVRLESVPPALGAGSKATLVLQDQTAPAALLRFDFGDLPKELPATLPATGTYRIVVAQQTNPLFGPRYGGEYQLELEGSEKTVGSLRSEDWTE